MERAFAMLTFLQTWWKWCRQVLFSWRFVFGLLIVYGLVSPSQDIASSIVLDEADLLSATEEAALQRDIAAMASGLEVRFVVATAAQVPPEQLSARANQVLPSLGGERSWLSELLLPSAGNAVLIYYSEQPPLVQLRYGRSIWPRARIAAIDYGDGYAELQALGDSATSVPDFSGVARAASTELGAVGSVQFARELATQFIVFLDGTVLLGLLVPDFELWRGLSRRFAGPVLEGLGRFITNPFAYLLILGCAIPLVRAAVMLVSMAPFALLTRLRDPGCLGFVSAMILVTSLQIAIVVMVAWPALGLIWVAASGRAEDLLMLEALGLDPGRLPQFPQRLGIWALLALSVLMFILRALRATVDGEKKIKRKHAKRVEAAREMYEDGEFLEQQERTIYAEAADEFIDSAGRRRMTALWKGSVGAAVVWVVPAWLAIMIGAYSLAYELVPIRFGQRE